MQVMRSAVEPSVDERHAVDRLVDSAGFDPSATSRTGVGGRSATRRDLLLPALHALNDAAGRISAGGLAYACGRLGVPRAEAFGVATFYDLFTVGESDPPAVRVCDDIVCGPRADALMQALDGVPAERCACLGRCDSGAASLVTVPGEGLLEVPNATVESVDRARHGVDDVAHRTDLGSIGERVLLARAGVVDPASLAAYRENGGYRVLAEVARIGGEGVIQRIERSELRGRGGAAFPTATKWRSVASAAADPKYVVCNADESEPGAFKDRVVLELDPFAVVEGMTLAGLAVGARSGIIYVRGEYTLARRRIEHAIDAAREAGVLGPDVVGSGSEFDIEVRRGAGAYVCGEETALFRSIEGFRGEPRDKPPYPTVAGLFGAPTVINNVETLVSAVAVVGGADARTKLFPVSGAVARPGLYEAPLGSTIADLVAAAGGTTGTTRAVLVGGAAGRFVGPEQLDVRLGARSAPVPMGSGALIVFDDHTDFDRVVGRIARFFRDESCGQCVPCRIGTVRQVDALNAWSGGSDDRILLDDLAAVMRDASICGLGQSASDAVQSALDLGLVSGGGSRA